MSEVAERTQGTDPSRGVESAAFVAVCRLDEIPRLGARVWERQKRDGGNIALFRTADDRVFALDDRCPHKGGPLSQGIVHGDRVSCPLHGWNIVLDNGQAVAPDQGCAARHDVRIEQGLVLVRPGSPSAR